MPGEEAQVDWGSFGKFRIGGAERALSCFVMVLSWSRATFARFTLDQTLESFLRCHVEGFGKLGGVPRAILYDNLKSVVLERQGDLIRFHNSVLRLDFVAEPRNVVLVAPQGLGKTMIAQNIAHHAALAGHSALFISAAQLLLDLGSQESARALDRRLKHYAKIGLLILDEIGFLAFDNRNADLLFQVISRRYERKSTVLTTNLAFRDWPTIFPNATCATALIDRVVHHADVIAIEGDSYRAREADSQAKERRSRRKDPTNQRPPADLSADRETARPRLRRARAVQISTQSAARQQTW